MKGLAMLKIGEIGWIEKERPACGPRDAVVRPLALAPCTSDIHTVWEGAIGDRHNLILGHEALGIVDEVGSEVKDFKSGDRVIVPAITPDWETDAAQRGFPSQTGGPLGGWKFSNSKDGVFGEFFHVNLADYNLAHLPKGMSLEAGVMLPDMLSTGFAGAENANIKFGSTVAVLGIGPVGLSAIAGAKLRGAGRIFAVGTRPASVKVAKEYGATHIVNYKEGDTVEQIRNATNGEGVDAVIVAGGGYEVMMDAINVAKPGSVVSNINYFGSGMGDQDVIPLPRIGWGFGMADKNIMTGLCPGGRVRMERLAEVVMCGRMDPALMATHVFKGFDKLEEALLLMKEKPKDLIKPVVIVEE
ncbi:NAD(P)-dependent alcohol dehydrogenase [Methanoculleus sp. Wushi-C6]|uniref:NAD(P)-dependent alcohol dehydrogenase n=1 Tax=Methanoculleus caldifontis TaxID=2651577 RepID=A0ABU3X1A7_9EURY|nr:NAD(P)-dependent alcohol dehydrogenase [Methanoculleus sp. Wushi-C6]MDV2481843.1 NAD(P)-dependent alcohol dehydrogenase [Methanoculleus sp. Wushi-C6]